VTQFDKMVPTMLAKVIPRREDSESDAQYDARIQAAREAFDAFGHLNPVEQMLDAVYVLERRQKPECPAGKECAQNPIQREPEPGVEPPEGEMAEYPLGGPGRRKRILDSAPLKPSGQRTIPWESTCRRSGTSASAGALGSSTPRLRKMPQQPLHLEKALPPLHRRPPKKLPLR
jgi:hypothetical protein